MRRILFLTSALALSACNSTSDVNEDEIKPVDFVGEKKWP